MCKRIKLVRRWRDNPCFFDDFRRSMTLQSHSTEAVNRLPVNCIVGTHSVRCRKARFEDGVLLDPMLPAEGSYVSGWRLRVNVSPDELEAVRRT